MIFASKRKKAAQAATSALRVLVSGAQHFRGISTMMYMDPYVLGFVVTTASIHATAVTNSKISPDDLGLAIQAAMSDALNVNGQKLGEAAVDYMECGDGEYGRGSRDAGTLFKYTFGLIGDDDPDPVIQNAVQSERAFGSVMSGGDHRAKVAGAIMFETFNRRVRELQGTPSHA